MYDCIIESMKSDMVSIDTERAYSLRYATESPKITATLLIPPSKHDWVKKQLVDHDEITKLIGLFQRELWKLHIEIIIKTALHSGELRIFVSCSKAENVFPYINLF